MKLWIISTKEPFTHYSLDRFAEEAKPLDIAIEVFKPTELDFYVENGKPRVSYQEKILDLPDCLLVRTGAYTITYHSLSLMRFLELTTNVKVVNSFSTYTKSKDKLITAINLAAAEVPIPKTQLITANFNLNRIKEEFGFPVVVKEVVGARGNSVIFCDSPEDLDELLQLIITVRRHNAEFIIQECIKTSMGRDIRAYVVGDKVIGAIERKAKGEGRKANVSQGGDVQQVEVTPELEAIVRKIKDTVDLRVGGVDLLYSEKGYKACEVNLSAQFVGFEKATNMNIAKTILTFCKDLCEGK